MNWTNVMLVASGGALGAVFRHALNLATAGPDGGMSPAGTLSANVLGSLVIGFVWVLSERTVLSGRTALWIMVGLLGAFTTFSTYALEGYAMLRAGSIRAGVAYLFLSNLLALGAVAVGVLVGERFAPAP